MTWCNSNSITTQQEQEQEQEPENEREIRIVSSENHRVVACPSCGHTMELQDQAGIQDLPGLPAGVKFDPSDQEILEHLEAKVWSNSRKTHPLINKFIPTLEGENGICYTHPEKLPGVSKDGLIRHFFHRPSKAYTTGTRKRRKVHTDEDGGETRWHKTGKTRAVLAGGRVKGFKKILVLYTNYGRQRKPEKTNWVMHQYHLGEIEEEKDGELVASKVFYQTQPRQCGSSIKDPINMKSRNHSTGTFTLIKETTTTSLDNYYNTPLIAYNIEEQNREITTQLIPNLVVQGDGSSFMHNKSTTNASKGKFLERN